MDQYDFALSGERDGLWDWNLVSNRVHFSPRWMSMVGCEDGEIGCAPDEWLQRIHPEDLARVRAEIDDHLRGTSSAFDVHHRMRQRDGSYRWMACRAIIGRDGAGAPVRLMGSHVDVTADHVADPLTGLPNREAFADRLGRAIERAHRTPDCLYAVLLVEVDVPSAEQSTRPADRDPLLTATARRLETVLRGTADSPFPGHAYVVARVRSAQFAVLLEELRHVGDARVAAARVLADVLAPLQLHGRQSFPRASIGVAVSPTGYGTADEVLRDADAALYRARSVGANRCEIFDRDLLQSADAQLALETEMAEALDTGQFRLFYQPVVDAASRRIVGLEALARWQHPARGMLPPAEFIPIAERTGFILALEEWCLHEACRQLKEWQQRLPLSKDVWVSVNLSPIHFKQAGVVERVAAALRETGLEGTCLVLELTETVVVEDPASVKTQLMQLRVMGVRIGIDDFGTGHSTFAYLHQFPADFLKVDQSFVRGMEMRPDKADIIGTVAGLAGQLGLRVIAEGVESEAGLELVRSRHCEYLQGFLFSRPVDAEAAEALLLNGVSGAASEPGGDAGVVADAKAAAVTVTSAPSSNAPRRGARLRTWLPTAAATIGIVILVGLAGQLGRRPMTPPPVPPARAALAVEPPFVAPEPPARIPRLNARPSAAPSAPGVDSVGAPSTPRAPVQFAVEHQHVFGGCKGVLRVSSAGVSFGSDKNTKDSFSFEPGRFTGAVASDTLTIKDGRRTYRFKANRNDGPALLRAVDALANAHGTK